tara:strand:- start:3341 stop:3499 length:159 start_codon:yes stop_codon:yes gene_type:complete
MKSQPHNRHICILPTRKAKIEKPKESVLQFQLYAVTEDGERESVVVTYIKYT